MAYSHNNNLLHEQIYSLGRAQKGGLISTAFSSSQGNSTEAGGSTSKMGHSHDWQYSLGSQQ